MTLPTEIREDVERQLGPVTASARLCVAGRFHIYSLTAGGRRYLLKKYESATPEALKMEARQFAFLNSYLPEYFPTVQLLSLARAYLVFPDSMNTDQSLSGLAAADRLTADVAEAFGRALALFHSTLSNVSAPIPVQSDSPGFLLNGIPTGKPLAVAVSTLVHDIAPSKTLPILGIWVPGTLLLSGRTPTTFLDTSGLCRGNPALDVGLSLAYLLINAMPSVQKGRLFYSSFMKGYREVSTYAADEDEVRIAVLWGLYRLLSTGLNTTVATITPEEAELLSTNVLAAAEDPPRNLQAFINAILGTGELNFGRLHGRELSDTQIIYHKRSGSEFSINITNRCPNSCIFCIRDFTSGWHLKKLGGEEVNLYLNHEPTEEEVRSAVEAELAHWPTPPDLIKFCGYGEPVLRLDLVMNIARFLRRRCPEATVQLNTSGWPLLRDHGVEAISSLRDAGVNSFSVSLNAPDQATYDRIVRPGSYQYEERAFDLMIESLKAATALGISVKATVVEVPLIKGQMNECRRLAEACNAEFVAREFVGNELPGLGLDGSEVVERETKILDVRRDELITLLHRLGATHRLGGLTRLYHYDIPEDVETRQHSLNLINQNIPEYRRFFSVLSVIAKCIRDGSTLYARGGLLRIRCEPNGDVMLIYKEPEQISDKVKREKEFAYALPSEEEGIALVEQWGLNLSRFIEKNRESFVLDGVIFDIDTWPQIGTYLEIEAQDEMAIFQGMAKIGVPANLARGLHTESLFIEHGVDPAHLVFTDEELRQLGISRDAP